MKYFLLIPLIGITVFLFYRNSYVKFQPTMFDGNSYKTLKVDTAFYRNLEIVLRYNNVKYQVDERGKVLIRRSLGLDDESLYNYSEKALDTVWLNLHK